MVSSDKVYTKGYRFADKSNWSLCEFSHHLKTLYKILYGSSQAVISLVVNSTSFTYSFRLKRIMPPWSNPTPFCFACPNSKRHIICIFGRGRSIAKSKMLRGLRVTSPDFTFLENSANIHCPQ